VQEGLFSIIYSYLEHSIDLVCKTTAIANDRDVSWCFCGSTVLKTHIECCLLKVISVQITIFIQKHTVVDCNAGKSWVSVSLFSIVTMSAKRNYTVYLPPLAVPFGLKWATRIKANG
jgi:hypothetical protein